MQHYYSTGQMDKNLAGEAYSPTKGSWVTGERIIFGLMRIPAGDKSNPHSHPNEQHSIALSGSTRLNFAGQERVLNPGDFSFRPANTVHSGQVISDEDYVFVTAKDTSWGIQGIPADAEQIANSRVDPSVNYFFRSNDMEDRLIDERYSLGPGKWVEGERITFGVVRMPSGAIAEPNRYDSEQFLYVLGGSCLMDIEGDVHTCIQGDIIHIPAHAAHSGRVVSDEDFHFVAAMR